MKGFLLYPIIFFQTDCDLIFVIPPVYWKYVVLPSAFATYFSVTVVYIKILCVARAQIKSIELLVVQVRLFKIPISMLAVTA